jgi:hypothetical protein
MSDSYNILEQIIKIIIDEHPDISEEDCKIFATFRFKEIIETDMMKETYLNKFGSIFVVHSILAREKHRLKKKKDSSKKNHLKKKNINHMIPLISLRWFVI